jgi:hypothetical protein
MHYTYVDGKRVSNHRMKDCRTFIKLQEAVGSNKLRHEAKDMQGPRGHQPTTRHCLPQTMERRQHKDNRTRVIKTTKGIFHQRGTSPQWSNQCQSQIKSKRAYLDKLIW